MDAPRPHTNPDSDYQVCRICPSLRFPREDFVIYDRPNRECPFNQADGYRYTAEGTPACVHPHKIGLEPDRIAPTYTPEPPGEEAATPSPGRRWRGWRPSFRAR
ncbi:hypothetical protein GCM10022403_041450 [Streptomyces coacervatus]|uniref:Uncharacterized protein n=1 Tax=Streptomyces coacervatus TaxID=647381 RepID=A0ABP7HV79_9ACTN